MFRSIFRNAELIGYVRPLCQSIAEKLGHLVYWGISPTSVPCFEGKVIERSGRSLWSLTIALLALPDEQHAHPVAHAYGGQRGSSEISKLNNI